MKKLIALTISLVLYSFVLSVDASLYSEAAYPDDLDDMRTFSSNPTNSQDGLGGYWPYSFAIDWDISQDTQSLLWTYTYRLSADRKDISHFILEVSPGATENDFSNFSVNGNPLTYGSGIEGPNHWSGDSNGNSNPDFPSETPLYGIKFDIGGADVTYQLTTNRAPVWGNFYAKSGKDKGTWVTAYNNALATNNFDSDNKFDFIARPNGAPPVVPEPVSSILFLSGSVALGIRHVLKKQKKA